MSGVVIHHWIYTTDDISDSPFYIQMNREGAQRFTRKKWQQKNHFTILDHIKRKSPQWKPPMLQALEGPQDVDADSDDDESQTDEEVKITERPEEQAFFACFPNPSMTKAYYAKVAESCKVEPIQFDAVVPPPWRPVYWTTPGTGDV